MGIANINHLYEEIENDVRRLFSRGENDPMLRIMTNNGISKPTIIQKYTVDREGRPTWITVRSKGDGYQLYYVRHFRGACNTVVRVAL